MPLNNTLEVISKDQFDKIHNASLKILKETGIKFHCPEALEMFKKNGAKVDGETVFITEKMVTDALATCPSTFEWTARNPKHSVTVGEGFLVQPNVGPVFIQDMENGRRKATLEDYANVIKICQAGKYVHLNGTIPVDPSDVDSEAKHLHMMYEILKNTDKPIIGFCFEGDKVRQNFDMINLAFGGADFLEDHHCLGVLVNPLTPLGFASETVETIMAYAKRNQVTLLAPCIMAGISGPISLLGTAVLQNTELLAGIVLTQMTRPGAPIVYATASTTGHMQTGAFAAGTPEAMLINTPNIQMGNEYYNLPTRTMCGITHSKELDCQAGYETMMSLLMGVLSGANIGVQCLGTLDALMTLSYEKMIIDQEIISRCLRIKQGINTTDEDLAVKAIQEIGHGGTYLMHPSTFKECRNMWSPDISDWNAHDAWEAAGKEDLVTRANKTFKEVLAKAPETLLDPDVDTALKDYINKVGL
ncbi:trimethylamine---corrinoid protein Co-methyltransferase [Desulfocicer vacuolatum DSM 3385]|uniref:Methyltransferase n=1 Tax=Desulfocicer vacuolatum DSM 3385 TaxID=1121400 RepID=A0A1W2DQX4_9BACT|nr:trimethylamine methyltransferase family protein [Desulfocicer vacuolatum]SMC99442.1 trimethylamine---corrinoid protein Co-methyltransferase [Desulfocicer vacuolatum DSM 3385]